MTAASEAADVGEVRAWWETSITEILPGVIRLRGYPIEQVIGNVSLTGTIWLLLRGELPSPIQSSLLEAALVASVDHGPQAPSIATARMAATCGVGINNAVATGVNVLGDVHGGAGQQFMELLLAIAQRRSSTSLHAAVEEVIDAYRRDHRYVPGFGHRFHPVDPRCAPLFALLDHARRQGDIRGLFTDIGQEVGKYLSHSTSSNLPMNIDGITAVVYSELGFPPELARGLFVLSRSVGVLANAWEEKQGGRRIKGPLPPSLLPRYVGPPPRDLPASTSPVATSATDGQTHASR